MGIIAELTKLADNYPVEYVSHDFAADYRCPVCRENIVTMPGDFCERCSQNKMRGYEALQMPGRCANGCERDHGTLTHAVKFGTGASMCKRRPGRRTPGWVYPYQSSNAITCPRCLAAVKKASAE